MSDLSANDLTVWGIGTARAMRVHWMALELGLDYQCRPVRTRTAETRSDEFTKLNPKQKIPVLCHGALVLSESAAILAYLAEAFSVPDDFYVPEDAAARARLNEWCYFIMSELDAHSLYLIRRHEGLKEIYGAAPAAVASAREYFLKQANAVDGRVEAAGAYLMGEKFAVADILMMTCLDWANAYDIDLPPALRDYRARVGERPAYQRALRVTYPERFDAGG